VPSGLIIEFVVASVNSISSSTAEVAAKGGAIMINVNGAVKWLRFYDSAI